MAFSGRFVSARQASDWGLVSRAVPAGELMADVMALAQEIAERRGHRRAGVFYYIRLLTCRIFVRK